MLARVPRRLLRDEAYDAIRDAIVAGVLAPGEQIRDGELAARVGLSRTPVREALARLAQEGLVESIPNSSTRVTPLAEDDARDAYIVLRALQALAVELAVPRLGDGHIARLEAANASFAEALDGNDVTAALNADDSFHGTFVEVAGNRLLADAVARCVPLIRRLERLRFGSGPGRRSVRIHASIIQAAAAGATEVAVRHTVENWSTLGVEIDRAFGIAGGAGDAREAPAPRRGRPASLDT